MNATNEKLEAERARQRSELSALLVEFDLPLQDASAIREFLEHDDLGVALEEIVDAVIDSEAGITEQQCRRVLDAAKAMGMLKREPQEWSRRMETLLSRVEAGR